MTTVKELRALAKEAGIVGYSQANKARLLEMLENEGKSLEKTEETTETEEPTKTEEPAKTPRKKREPSVWNRFLADYVKEHGCPLKEAMKAKDAYAEYKTKQGKKAEE